MTKTVYESFALFKQEAIKGLVQLPCEILMAPLFPNIVDGLDSILEIDDLYDGVYSGYYYWYDILVAEFSIDSKTFAIEELK